MPSVRRVLVHGEGWRTAMRSWKRWNRSRCHNNVQFILCACIPMYLAMSRYSHICIIQRPNWYFCRLVWFSAYHRHILYRQTPGGDSSYQTNKSNVRFRSKPWRKHIMTRGCSRSWRWGHQEELQSNRYAAWVARGHTRFSVIACTGSELASSKTRGTKKLCLNEVFFRPDDSEGMSPRLLAVTILNVPMLDLNCTPTKNLHATVNRS